MLASLNDGVGPLVIKKNPETRHQRHLSGPVVNLNQIDSQRTSQKHNFFYQNQSSRLGGVQ